MSSPAVAGGAARVIWLTPDEPAFTVAGQRRDLTELPPQGSGRTLSGDRAICPVASLSVRRTLVGVIVAVALIASACATPSYTSAQAAQDLEHQAGLTSTQATCIVAAIRHNFEAEIKAAQKANKGSALPADQLKLEIDGALATLQNPSGAEQLATRQAIVRCAPGALK